MKSQSILIIDGIKRIPISAITLIMVIFLTAQSSVLAASPRDRQITDVQYEVIHGDIVHYTYDVKTGPGDYDKIRLHRVVRERAEGRPIVTEEGIFMIPGAINYFTMIFMTSQVSAALEWDQSFATYLAKNNIDVWGMDYRWALVPPETTDFSFMEDWGLQMEIDDADIAMSIAQQLRRSTGQGDGRMHVLGFSNGAPITYALAGQETQMPYGLRKIKGIIPVDMVIKLNDENELEKACSEVSGIMDLLDAGIYHGQDGVFLKLFADLAEFDPDGTSPIAPSLTNLQFVRFVGTNFDGWHFVGGNINEFFFTQEQVFIDALQAAPPYISLRQELDITMTICPDYDTPFDDHLGDITVPILYVGAAGGFGELGIYSTLLTASDDIQELIIQLLPDDQQYLDFGHADLFLGEEAEELVWSEILDWLLGHNAPGMQQIK